MGSSAAATHFEVRDFSVQAGGEVLLTGLDLALQPREIAVIKGPSGCGKTTLLRALAKLIEPAGGTVRLRGHEPESFGLPGWRRRVMYVSQRPVLLPQQTVDQNLRWALQFRSAAGLQPSPERAARLLGRLGLAERQLEQPARILSEGERQRVCLVRALLLEPDVLLLDEPTSALDSELVKRVEDVLLEHLTRHAAAALVVTHAPDQMARLGAPEIDLLRYAQPRAGAAP